MAEEGFKRKLTAILSADVAGYSRLMAEDETFTVKTIASYREVIASLIKQHRGRVVDSPGDNVLAEFSSVVDAVQCAVAVQNEIQTQNAKLPDNRRMEFRIGINLGDVIDEEDRIYGDGVNIAARLEALADPGGICVSKTAFDQIETKLPLGYEYLGEQSVKNIPKPVGAYRVLMKPDAVGKVIGEKRFLGKLSRKMALAAIMVLVIVAGGLIGWNIYLQQSKKVEPASKEKMAFPLPDKPSIAVLPFDNMSGDSELQFFSDGLVEEIIHALTSVPEFLVIARNSTFTYKDKPVKVQQVSEELGVQYVLEGSVRKSGEKVRVTAQLIDALKGHHLWAETYDRNIEDLFAVQEEITVKVITELRDKITGSVQTRFAEPCSMNLEAYLKYLKAEKHFYRLNKEDNAIAKRLVEEAIALDPEYACAYSLLSGIHRLDVLLGSTNSPERSLATAKQMVDKAIELNPTIAGPHGVLAHLYRAMGEHEKAIEAAEKAVTLGPNSILANGAMGMTLLYASRSEEAISFLEKTIRIDPFSTTYVIPLGLSYFLSGQNEEAIGACKAVADKIQSFDSYLCLAAAYSAAGREKEASSATSEILRMNPKFTLKWYSKIIRYKNSADKELIISNLRKAGLPD